MRSPPRPVDVDGLTDEATVASAAPAIVGEIQQVPSAVSAIKVDGKRAYQRVRDGEEVELKAARRSPSTSSTVTDVRGDWIDVDISVRCSSGTYIRPSPATSAPRSASGGHLTALRRTAVGPFDLADARTLDSWPTTSRVVPIADAAGASSRRRPRRGPGRRRRVGRTLDLDLWGPGRHAVFDPDGEFLALYEQRGAPGRPVAVFVGDRPARARRQPRTVPPVQAGVQIWRSTDDVPADLGRTVVTIGNFDGVHLGHQHVSARARGSPTSLGVDRSWR